MMFFRVLAYIAGLTLGAAYADTLPERIVATPHGLQAHLIKGEFADLEAIASDYRASGARLSDGTFALETYYEVLDRIKESCGPCGGMPTEYTFEEKRVVFDRWISAYPNSVTPKIGLAGLWKVYAWVGRGHGFAFDTTQDQFVVFTERLKRSENLLRNLDHAADPYIYELEMESSLAANDPRAALDTIYVDAVRAFPAYENYADRRYEYLTERWFGRPGEARDFLKSLLSDSNDVESLRRFFRTAGVAISMNPDYAHAFEVAGADYPQIARAFSKLAVPSGPPPFAMNAMMYYATAAHDKKAVVLLSQKIGGNLYTRIWRNKTVFDGVVSWAQTPL